jgi:5-methylcytosine-specific restriction protein B
MNFWHIQLHPDNKADYPPERIKKILETNYIGMGDEWDERQIDQFSDELAIGDIVAVRSGSVPIALVEVIGEKETHPDPNKDLDWFPLRRKIRMLDCSEMPYNYSIPKAQGTFSKCANPSVETSKVIINWFNRIKNNKEMNDLIELLKSNNQIVLTGAPGTGKTHLARQIAAKMIGLDDNKVDDLENHPARFNFVQFHPAYDYTDFVEGLKPVNDGKVENGQIAFEVRAGLFMKFCKDADELLKTDKENGMAPRQCVFVIDEINRADLSRVFGELFYALEPGYRGEKGAVSTQYVLGRKESDRKKFHVPENVFIIGTMNDIDRSVESIDFALRRRFAWYEVKADGGRFDAVIQPDLEENFKAEAKARYLSLNGAIGKTEELGESYQIGPAYFRNLKQYVGANDIWEKFWERHLELLVREYVRGWPKSKKDEQVNKFKAAYNLALEPSAQS